MADGGRSVRGPGRIVLGAESPICTPRIVFSIMGDAGVLAPILDPDRPVDRAVARLSLDRVTRV